MLPIGEKPLTSLSSVCLGTWVACLLFGTSTHTVLNVLERAYETQQGTLTALKCPELKVQSISSLYNTLKQFAILCTNTVNS